MRKLVLFNDNLRARGREPEKIETTNACNALYKNIALESPPASTFNVYIGHYCTKATQLYTGCLFSEGVQQYFFRVSSHC